MVTKNVAAVLHNHYNCLPSKVKSINHMLATGINRLSMELYLNWNG